MVEKPDPRPPLPSRWKRARQDSPGFELRDLASGAGGLVLAVVVLAASGSSLSTLAEVGIVGGSGIAAALLYPFTQLLWAWHQAPMRMLREDVIAIRERVEQLQPAAKPVTSAAKVNIRATLLVHLRKGREIVKYVAISPVYIEQWTDDVTDFLNQYAAPGRAEEFQEVTQNTGRAGMEERIAYLQQIADQMKAE